MDVIIGATVSALGAYFGGMDFCTLYTFISIGMSTYKAWNDHLMIKLRRSKNTF